MSRQIKWDDLDKSKFYFYGTSVFLGIRACVYPSYLIKTRLQVQKGKDVYRGSFDAFIKLFKAEGLIGFYRGFPVHAMGVLFGQAYITTYEYTKHKCSHLNLFLQGLLPGALASVAGQTFSVPADVIVQRLQIQGMKPRQSLPRQEVSAPKQSSVLRICRNIIKHDGLSGFYRGYLVSLLGNVPTSAIWWGTYLVMLQKIGSRFESDSLGHDKLHVQAFCGVVSGVAAAMATNPLDVMKTRIQVGGSRSVVTVTKKLWGEEGMAIFVKGLTARSMAMATSSFLTIVGYETVKRLSYQRRTDNVSSVQTYS